MCDSDLARVVQLELTTQCNMKCFYCPIEDMNAQHMDFATAVNIVDMYPPGTKFKLNGTGEPTLYPHLVALLKYIKSKGGKSHIITNGKRLVNEEVLEIVDEIMFSIDEDVSMKKVKTLSRSGNALKHAVYIAGKDKVSTIKVNYGQFSPELVEEILRVGI
jgi:MoaA/NifB/PqqE/SkfB family radical SAM enzyme